MDNRKVAQQVIEHLGGKENITNALHCVTRLRFNVKEDAKVNGAAIEAIDGVMGMQIKNGQYQIIIGPMVADVFLEVEDLLGHSGSEAPKTRMGNVLDIITGIFSAILPALVAGGMLKGILAMLEAMGMSSGGGTWTVFSVISDVPFYFLPFLLAVSAARKFKVNEYLGLCVAGALMYPTFVDAVGAAENPFSKSDRSHVVL